jgi:hypothetical protein
MSALIESWEYSFLALLLLSAKVLHSIIDAHYFSAYFLFVSNFET